MQLILDVGSGASLPDQATARRFVDEVAKRDGKKHKIVFKAQLFQSAPPNVPLLHEVFAALHGYGMSQGYAVTASVFDKPSLDFLLAFDPPLVKIACRPKLYWLAGEVPRKVPVYMSADLRNQENEEVAKWASEVLCCVPKYPAKVADYKWAPLAAVSDHTYGWELLKSSKGPEIWEKHLVLKDTTGPDDGPWAVLPEELEEIIA